MARKKRITLDIHLFNGDIHRAQVLPHITMGELIQEILLEFGPEYRYLDQHNVQGYALWLPGSDRALPSDRSMEYLGRQQTLIFREKQPSIPAGTEWLPKPIYLRYRSHVFKIIWQPAFIGRPEPGSTQNDLLAVNLEPYSLAVSRQQAEIVWAKERCAIRRLSPNPLLLNGELLPFDTETPKQSTAMPLQDGDVILLEHSGITLTCLQPDKDPGEP